MKAHENEFAIEDEYNNNEEEGRLYLDEEIPILVKHWHEMLMHTKTDILKGDYLSQRVSPNLSTWVTQFISPNQPMYIVEDCHEKDENYNKKHGQQCKIAYSQSNSSYNNHYTKRK